MIVLIFVPHVYAGGIVFITLTGWWPDRGAVRAAATAFAGLVVIAALAGLYLVLAA